MLIIIIVKRNNNNSSNNNKVIQLEQLEVIIKWNNNIVKDQMEIKILR